MQALVLCLYEIRLSKLAQRPSEARVDVEDALERVDGFRDPQGLTLARLPHHANMKDRRPRIEGHGVMRTKPDRFLGSLESSGLRGSSVFPGLMGDKKSVIQQQRPLHARAALPAARPHCP